jgi:sulfonate transport system substrate-binding protein
MNSRIYRSLFAVAALALAAHAADVPKVIRLGWVGNKYNKAFTGGIVGYAQETQAWEKEFAKDGIKIEWSFFTGTGPAINEAIANGEIDIASTGDLPSTSGHSNGLPTRVIVGGGAGGGTRYILVSVNSTIKKPADLKGKRITFQKGTYAHLGWDRYARDVLHFDGEKEAKVYSLTGGDQDVALASGSVDAIYGGGLDLVDRGVARIIDSVKDNTYPTVAWNAGSTYTTQKFIDKYPDVVYRFVKVYLKIADEVERNDKKDLLRRLDTKSGTSLKNVIAAEPEDYRYSNLPIFDELYRVGVDRAIKDELSLKLLRHPFVVTEWWDRTFYDRAFAELGLGEKWKDVIAKRAERLKTLQAVYK